MTTPKPSLAQRGKDKAAGRAAAAIEPALEPGEQILAGARVQSGVSQWWLLLTTYAALFQRWYYMALTDRRVIFCRLSFWTGRPTAIKIVTPREQARVTSYRPGRVWTSFWLSYPGREKPMRFRAPRAWRPEIDSLLGALGAAGLEAAGPITPAAPPAAPEFGGPAPG